MTAAAPCRKRREPYEHAPDGRRPGPALLRRDGRRRGAPGCGTLVVVQRLPWSLHAPSACAGGRGRVGRSARASRTLRTKRVGAAAARPRGPATELVVLARALACARRLGRGGGPAGDGG